MNTVFNMLCQITGSNWKPMSKPCLLFHSSVLVNVLTWSAALRFQCRPSLVSSVALQRSHLNVDGLCADVYAPLKSQHWGAVLQTATVAHAGPKSITNNSHTLVTRQVSSVNWIAQRLHVRRESSGLFWWHILTASFHFQKIITILVQLACKVMFFTVK